MSDAEPHMTRLLTLLLLAMNATSFADNVPVWIGTKTPRNGLSQGIYHLTFNTDTGRLSQASLAAEISNPGWVTISSDGKRLYAAASQAEPVVAAYAIDGKKLKLINSQPIGDGGACHVSEHPSGRFLMTAQYGGGSVAVFPLKQDGSIGKRSQLIEHEGGSRVVGNRQDSPHPHWTGYSPSKKFAFVPDLGLDAVVVYRVNENDGTIESTSVGTCPRGSGPRHMKFHPDGKHVFVLNELAMSITTFHFDATAGKLTPLSTVPTLSDVQKGNQPFNAAAEIRVHPNGKFVYSSNRGHDSISAFRFVEGGLIHIEVESIRGGFPRNFNIDPSGKWLLAAGSDSNTLTVFSIDQNSGALTYDRGVAFVPNPICIAFGK